MSLALAIHDAANNCARDSAKATITLRSGVTITGELQKPGAVDGRETVHIRHGEGWSTALVSEVAAVSSHR